MNTSEEASRYLPREFPKPSKNGTLERWEIDLSGSRLGFVLRHLVVSQIRGQFRRWGGTLYLNRAEPWLSSVHVWVELASIETDSVERDEHLRSPEFLDIGRYQRAEFDSTSVEPHEDRLVLRGLLKLHGVTRDLDLEVEPREPKGPKEPNDVYRVRAKLDRQAFGLHWNQDLDFGGVVVGDVIDLAADVKVVRS